MKKTKLFIGLGLATILTIVFVYTNTPISIKKIIPSSELEEIDKKTRVDEYFKQEFEKTRSPITGQVDRSKLTKIRTYAAEELRKNNMLRTAISGVTWTERGPNNIGGRTRAVLIDENDATNKTIWAGGVGGGLWKTTDITASDPSWVSIDDTWDNIAVTAIAQDPVNNDNIYVGTGEGWFNIDAIQGLGIWKSSDGGSTWAQLSSTNNDNFNYVLKLMTDGTYLYAATRSGLFQSDDDGSTWSEILGNGTGGGSSDFITDIEIAADGDLYASLHSDGIYYSSDDGVNWTKQTSGLPSSGFGRIELAIAPSDATRVYAIYADDDNTVYGSGIYKTTNGGTSWAVQGMPQICDQGTVKDVTRNQAWYDLIMVVNPGDEDIVLVGGIDAAKSTDGGATWSYLSSWTGGYSGSGACTTTADYVHADLHAIVFDPDDSNIFYIGCDGGLFRTSDGGTTFNERNTGYNITQYYAADLNPTAYSSYFIAGAQDNGTLVSNRIGIASATEATGGDGAFCHIDQDNANVLISAYTNNYLYYSYDGGSSFSNLLSSSSGSFINTTELDDDANILYSNGGSGQLYRITNLDGTTTPGAALMGLSGIVGSFDFTAMTADPNTSNRLYVGINSMIYRIDDADGTPVITDLATSTSLPTSTDGSPSDSGYISSIVVEDGNANHIVVTYSNYDIASVWETTDGGANWTDIEGNLPNMPVRWALFNPNDADQILLATEVGVWSTDNINGSSTDWDPTNGGLANCRVDMLKYRSSDGLVLAATHGRGLFTTDAFTSVHADFVADNSLTYAGTDIQFTDGSYKATSWSWTFGDGGTSTDQHPIHAYSSPGTYTVTLSINSGAETETKTDYITILPQRGIPYATTDGGSFDVNVNDFAATLGDEGSTQLWEKGQANSGTNAGGFSSSSDVWITLLDGAVPVEENESALYTPEFNMSAAATTPYVFNCTLSMNRPFTNWPAGLQVQYTTDRGVTWTRLGDVATDWYNTSSSFSSIFSDQTCFLANYNSKAISLDISSLAGNSAVAFRFVYSVTTNSFVSGDEIYYGGAIGAMLEDFNITGPTNVALPVELASYDGKAEEKGNRLSWSTLSEQNNDYFTLKHSLDGNSFKTITEINGVGNSVEEQRYNFLHETNIAGIHYYQLSQTDFDQTTKDLGIVSVQRNQNIDIKIGPNPFIEYLELTRNNTDQSAKIYLIDAQGKIVLSTSAGLNEDKIQLNTRALAKGFYQLVIEQGMERKSFKVLKNK